MKLVWPSAEYLPGYVHALKQGWSPDNLRPDARFELLERISEDSARFLQEQVDREGKGPPVTLVDGSQVPRLPGYSQWMWDGEFCGAIGFRWQPAAANYLLIAWAILVTRLSPGKDGEDTQPKLYDCSFPRCGKKV